MFKLKSDVSLLAAIFEENIEIYFQEQEINP